MKRNRIWFVVVAAVALMSCATGRMMEKPTAHDWFQRGMELEKANVAEEALKMYTEAIALDPYYAEAYFRRGKARTAVSKTYVMEALQDFDRTIALDPRHAEAYYERGLLNAFSLNNESARTDMQTAAGLGHKGARQWLGLDQQEKGREAERPATVAAAAPGSEMVQPPPAAVAEDKAGRETADAFFAPGKRLPSGSEPVVRFDHNMANIKAEFTPVLDEVAKILSEKTPEAVVVLAGHTDNTGTERYNQGLSVRRAKAVESYLTGERGIPSKRLSIEGFGESAPAATNDTAEGRAKNRRVEILVPGKAGEPAAAATK